MGVKVGNHLAVYNSGGVTLSDGDSTGLFVSATGALITTTTLAPTTTTTATQTSVSDSASSGTILASNTNRYGASITNDSSARLYLRLSSSAATTTTYTVSLGQNDYYEVPFGYTGAITGIWASDPNDGAARVTEWTA